MCSEWIQRLEKAAEAIVLLGGFRNDLVIGEPASEHQVLAVEEKLGYRLPEDFRDILLNFAAHIDYGWRLNDCIDLPYEFRNIFASEFSWNIELLLYMEEERKGWIKECFPDPNNEYDKVWHNKLAFIIVGNGDYIAFDLAEYPEYTPVVYLSHDDGEGHGCILGNDFKDFMNRWTLIGCPGSEDWQMAPFIETKTDGINPNSLNGMRWRKLIGLDF